MKIAQNKNPSASLTLGTSPEGECREKYQDYFQSYNDTIAGKRGVSSHISMLEQRNKALENGWDPARIDDIVPIDRFTKQSKALAEMFEEIKDPRLNRLEALNKTMVSLSPENKKFRNQRDYDLYNLRIANTAKTMLEESKKPEVRQALTDAMAKCDAEQIAYKQYEDLRRNEFLAHRNDPTVVVRPAKPVPVLASNTVPSMIKTLNGDDITQNAEFRQFVKEMDITKQRFKGTAEEIANRENEIKAAQKYRDLTKVSETVNIIAANAAKKVARMERDLDGLKYPSKEYTEMKLALINVAQLSKGENSISSSLEALDTLSEKTDAYLNRTGVFGNDRTAFAKANELYDNITKDIASLIASRQLEKLVVNSKMSKEDQQAFPFNNFVEAIRSSEAFVRMITPPQNGDKWAYMMDLKQRALQNDGKDIQAKYLNTASSLANENFKSNNAPKKAPVLNNQLDGKKHGL